eukprot:1852587-Rhodomonas_salina.1
MGLAGWLAGVTYGVVSGCEGGRRSRPLSPYACATRYPVLSKGMLLRACYGVCGTARGYGATRVLWDGMVLRDVCTEVGYGASSEPCGRWPGARAAGTAANRRDNAAVYGCSAACCDLWTQYCIFTDAVLPFMDAAPLFMGAVLAFVDAMLPLMDALLIYRDVPK